MTLWTIQTEATWEEFGVRGVLHGGHDRIVEPSWQEPYRWMVGQMIGRIGPAPSRRVCPLWAWLQWEGANRPRPDLRAGGHLPKGERGVRIEFECPDEGVLLSDFDLWHCVLNYWYLPESEEEGDRFEAELNRHALSFYETKPLPNPKYHQRIVKSWERIFDLDWSEPELAYPRHRKSIQGTLWEVSMDHVRDVKPFTAR